MNCLIPLVLVGSPTAAPLQTPDLREGYDVLSYHLDLRVDPSEKSLGGDVTIRAKVVDESLAAFAFDLSEQHTVTSVSLADKALEYERDGALVRCELPEALGEDEEFAVTVSYAREEREALASGRRRRRSAVLWAETEAGLPWVGTSCQGPGAHAWWPCKSNYFNPEDKPESVRIDLTVPEDLYAVSNGKLESITESGEGWRKFTWQHDYPLETYTVTANVAPYVVVERDLELPGIEKPVPFIYYVLPENAEKAALQFQDVPEMLEIFSEAFGPWPFPDAKFALVETSFWGMEHSTAVAYGSSYPAWCQKTGAKDRYERRNRDFDYILVHESAHEWWGNAVSANDWGHFWIHEGFGTYAEGVYIEKTIGRERADAYFAAQGARSISPKGSLYRGEDPESGAAYSGLIYSKGAAVLHTLRHYVNDDDAWWDTLRTFNLRHRYGNADTEDFRAVLEEKTGREWEQFFAEWFYGAGAPSVTGSISLEGGKAIAELECTGNGATEFHVPVDIAWTEDGESKIKRLWLDPGSNQFEWKTAAKDVQIVHLERLLGKHDVQVNGSD